MVFDDISYQLFSLKYRLITRINRMVTQKDASNEKRPNDTFEPERNKRMRPATPDDPYTPTKITDLDDDCLEYIFKKIDITDLLSVADSS